MQSSALVNTADSTSGVSLDHQSSKRRQNTSNKSAFYLEDWKTFHER